MTRFAIYCRYSSEMQSERSIEDQLRLCLEHGERQGWTFVQTYRDAAISGASAFRPGYQAMLSAARDAAFDVIVAEALDRLSRDQEDTASLFKRMKYAGIRIVTLSEGEISELHVGLTGAMNALYLKELAAKTRRGLRGRVEAGKSAGSNAYGYDVVRALRADGVPVTGERCVNASEAEVVRRIFSDYANGVSPKQIALRLNAEGVRGPRGGAWSPSTINGNRRRGTGILNNELYVGRLVWNRLTYQKDPETGRRRSRARSGSEVIAKDVPELRIVPDDLWQAARQRQAVLDHGNADTPALKPFWSKQRARYLFSGKIRCGVCGAGFSMISATNVGCSGARNKGPTVCRNTRTLGREALEGEVLTALRERLMDPELFKVFAEAFTEEWNRGQAEAAGRQTALRSKLRRTGEQIERLVDAIANGTPVVAVRDRLTSLEEQRKAMEGELATAARPAPLLHPALPDVYRRQVAALSDALKGEDSAGLRDQLRGLVDEITVYPVGSERRIVVRGALAPILNLAEGGLPVGKRSGSGGVLAEQVKMVAGIGFEPMTFRL